MRVGGNRKAKDFFSSQDDWDDAAPIQRKYNSRAAALYKDKVRRFLSKSAMFPHLFQAKCWPCLQCNCSDL